MANLRKHQKEQTHFEPDMTFIALNREKVISQKSRFMTNFWATSIPYCAEVIAMLKTQPFLYLSTHSYSTVMANGAKMEVK
ncbi:hypothetical protein CEXT_402641 [Caerostris extrusa]|uniref:Uncharacterized protein n=1 Tax=Caerostris extrusa TaxID=172846 RepID=A0AAV4WE03_CAEEX|nr:hypothetical protein CEXT_402641 [Caerostris extrusa]